MFVYLVTCKETVRIQQTKRKVQFSYNLPLFNYLKLFFLIVFSTPKSIVIKYSLKTR